MLLILQSARVLANHNGKDKQKSAAGGAVEPRRKIIPSPGGKGSQSEKANPGHGRSGAAAYQGAERIKISHASLPSRGIPVRNV